VVSIELLLFYIQSPMFFRYTERVSGTRFSTWISFPQAPDYAIGRFKFFQKFTGIFAAQGVVDTGGKWKKSSIRKMFIISFGRLWVVELAYRYFFSFKFILSC
jgi:hypothetical protein